MIDKDTHIDFNQLHYFLTVAETGKLSNSAQELYISQSTLSRAMPRFESEFGVSLLTGKG